MSNCPRVLMQHANALIKRQKAEIESLQAVHADMTESLRLASEANKDMQAELEDLREIVFMDRSEAIKNLKAEAIKEFAEIFKSKITCIPQHHFTLAEVLFDLNKLVKEMTEGRNESKST